MTRVRALAILAVAAHLLSCTVPPCEPPEAWPSPLPNGWPSYCASVVRAEFLNYKACHGEERPPSTRNVGVQVQFRFSGRITEPVPLVYLGVRELPEFDGRPLFGQTLGAHTMIWDPDTDKTTAPFAVWALPSPGTHVFVLPVGEVELRVPEEAVPTSGCVAPMTLDVENPGTFSLPSTSEIEGAGKKLRVRSLRRLRLILEDSVMMLANGTHRPVASRRLDEHHRVRDSFVYVDGVTAGGRKSWMFIGETWPDLASQHYSVQTTMSEVDILLFNGANMISVRGQPDPVGDTIGFPWYGTEVLVIPSLGIELESNEWVMYDRVDRWW